MARYVAFLRAINVGGRTVKMDRLRALFEALKLRNVETFIASGNVIFEASGAAAALETRIERHLKQALEYDHGTFLRSVDEVQAVARYVPFPQPGSASLIVTFLKRPLDPAAVKSILALRSETDDFRPHGRELYWLSHRGVGGSPAAPMLGRILGTQGTMRNVTTVRKLAAKYAERPAR